MKFIQKITTVFSKEPYPELDEEIAISDRNKSDSVQVNIL